MRKWPVVLMSVFLSVMFFVPAAMAGMEWRTMNNLNIEETPLDVAPSGDGQWLYILTRGAILVYSLPEGKIADRVAVDKEYDRIASLPRANALALSSSHEKNVQIIVLENVYKIDISGLPVKGPPDAPVTIAVFDDYQ